MWGGYAGGLCEIIDEWGWSELKLVDTKCCGLVGGQMDVNAAA